MNENKTNEIDHKNHTNKIKGNCISRQTRKLHITFFCEKSSEALQRYLLNIVYSAMNEATFNVGKWEKSKIEDYMIYETGSFPWVEISRFCTKIVYDIQTMYSPSMDINEYMPQNSTEDLFDEIPSYDTGDLNYNKKYFEYSKILRLKTEYDPELQRELLAEIDDKSDWEVSMKVQVITYNVSGLVPKDKEEIRKLLFAQSNHPLCKIKFNQPEQPIENKQPISHSSHDKNTKRHEHGERCTTFESCNDVKTPDFKPDIIAIGLQEVVELKAGNLFISLFKEDADKAWVKAVQECLDESSGNYQKDQYKLIEKRLQVGL